MERESMRPPSVPSRTQRNARFSESPGNLVLTHLLLGESPLNLARQAGVCRILAQSTSRKSTKAVPIQALSEHSWRLRTLLLYQTHQVGNRCPGESPCSNSKNPCCWPMMALMSILDLVVQFAQNGHRAQRYLLHFFPVETVKENVEQTFPEWTERVHFPPALLKLRARLEESIIPPRLYCEK